MKRALHAPPALAALSNLHEPGFKEFVSAYNATTYKTAAEKAYIEQIGALMWDVPACPLNMAGLLSPIVHFHATVGGLPTVHKALLTNIVNGICPVICTELLLATGALVRYNAGGFLDEEKTVAHVQGLLIELESLLNPDYLMRKASSAQECFSVWKLARASDLDQDEPGGRKLRCADGRTYKADAKDMCVRCGESEAAHESARVSWAGPHLGGDVASAQGPFTWRDLAQVARMADTRGRLMQACEVLQEALRVRPWRKQNFYEKQKIFEELLTKKRVLKINGNKTEWLLAWEKKRNARCPPPGAPVPRPVPPVLPDYDSSSSTEEEDEEEKWFGQRGRTTPLYGFSGINLCTVCQRDLGDCNPRQLCGKTYCENEC